MKAKCCTWNFICHIRAFIRREMMNRRRNMDPLLHTSEATLKAQLAERWLPTTAVRVLISATVRYLYQTKPRLRGSSQGSLIFPCLFYQFILQFLFHYNFYLKKKSQLIVSLSSVGSAVRRGRFSTCFIQTSIDGNNDVSGRLVALKRHKISMQDEGMAILPKVFPWFS